MRDGEEGLGVTAAGDNVKFAVGVAGAGVETLTAVTGLFRSKKTHTSRLSYVLNILMRPCNIFDIARVEGRHVGMENDACMNTCHSNSDATKMFG